MKITNFLAQLEYLLNFFVNDTKLGGLKLNGNSFVLFIFINLFVNEIASRSKSTTRFNSLPVFLIDSMPNFSLYCASISDWRAFCAHLSVLRVVFYH